MTRIVVMLRLIAVTLLLWAIFAVHWYILCLGCSHGIYAFFAAIVGSVLLLIWPLLVIMKRCTETTEPRRPQSTSEPTSDVPNSAYSGIDSPPAGAP